MNLLFHAGHRVWSHPPLFLIPRYNSAQKHLSCFHQSFWFQSKSLLVSPFPCHYFQPPLWILLSALTTNAFEFCNLRACVGLPILDSYILLQLYHITIQSALYVSRCYVNLITWLGPGLGLLFFCWISFFFLYSDKGSQRHLMIAILKKVPYLLGFGGAGVTSHKNSKVYMGLGLLRALFPLPMQCP